MKKDRGDISIYIAILMVTVLLSGALVFSSILSRQARFASNIVHNERAFYAADSGIEATLYDLKNKIDSGDESVSKVESEIPYGNEKATFVSEGVLSTSADQNRTQACVKSRGTFGRESRDLITGPEGCEIR